MAKGTAAQRQALERFLADYDYEEVPDPSREEVERSLHLVRDPKDVPIALAAINAKVDYLVKNDKNLTTQDETTATMRQKIQPMIVGKFLGEVMGWESDDLEKIRKLKWSDLRLPLLLH